MSEAQADLFGTPSRGPEPPGEEIVAVVRAPLRAALALVRGAGATAWPDPLAVIREDNAFRFGKDLLPVAEGAALRAGFNARTDRLRAVVDWGREPDAAD